MIACLTLITIGANAPHMLCSWQALLVLMLRTYCVDHLKPCYMPLTSVLLLVSFC